MKRPILLLALLWCAVSAFAAVTGTLMTDDGQPVAGAAVSIHAIETSQVRVARLVSDSPERVALAKTQSDSKGRFTFESPKDPLAILQIVARGYTPLLRTIERDEDAGAIVLARAEWKSGSVKAGGKPVAGATVVVSFGAAAHVTKTDAEGRYETAEPKNARILVLHPELAIVEDDTPFLPNRVANLNRVLSAGTSVEGKVVGADGQTPVAKATIFIDRWPVAESGEDGTFKVAHAPAKWSALMAQSGSFFGARTRDGRAEARPYVIKVEKGATVGGRITDAKTKVPIAGAYVRVGERRPFGFDRWSALTDAKGNFTLSVPAGAYMIFPSHPAYEGRATDVSVTAGQSVTKELTFTQLARVSGVVVDEERKPVAVATVTVQESRDRMEMVMRGTGPRDSRAVSGPDGRFSMRVSGDSDFKLRAAKRGLPAASSESIKVASGDRKSGVVISIPSGIAVTGKVTDRDGNPLSGVAVLARPAETGRRGMQRFMIGAFANPEDESVRTASDGTFSLRVIEGTYDFQLRREGFSSKNVRGKSITAAGTNTIEASLEPSVEISGRVTRGSSGVEGISIMGFLEGDPASAVSGPDGSFVLSGLSPGPVRVNLRKEDEMVGEMRTITAPGRDVVIELPVGTRVSGRVIDRNTRKPLTSFQVGMSQSRGGGGGMVMMAPPLLRSVTSDDGSFTLEHVPPGAMNLVAEAPGYSSARVNLHVEEGKPVDDLEVALDTGVKLVGKVTGPDGTALSDATVRISPMGGNVIRGTDKRTATNASGEYELDALEAGEETIEISHAKYLMSRKTVELKGRETRLDVQLEAGHRVSGVVVTESGAPVAEAEVQARGMTGGMPRAAKTDGSGSFELDSLSPARYTFVASKAGFTDGTVKDVDAAAGTPVRIVLSSGGTIFGFVRGLTAEELASATVQAYGTGVMSDAAVDASGAYRLEGAPAGTVRVMAVVQPRNFTGRKTSPAQTVQVAAGASQQVDLEFRSDTVISGRVVRNGRPVSGAQVSFSPRPGGAQTNASALTDESGSYSASGLEDGQYNVYVTDMQRFSTYTTTYEVRGASTFDIEYTATSVRGRVTDSSTGDPLENATVLMRAGSAQGPRGEQAIRTDAAGMFTFDVVPPGAYVVTANKEGFGNDAQNVTVGDRPLENLELRIARGEALTLKVIDARDGRQIGAYVSAFDAQGRVAHESRGIFGGGDTEVRMYLAPGMYHVTVAAPGYGTRHLNVRAPSSETVILSRGATILLRSKHSTRERVRLLDASGVVYPRQSYRPPFITMNPSPGTTPVDDVAAGSYTLQRLGPNDAVVESKQIMVGEGQTVDVEM
ncbi:MAG TPA: carboxypeptidase-like regulatory domain-containing protein [Thermoanaerobaculia bacterium]|nr:carboxypeptidase-like regulatory domain-containing protein [Thermoanaerobaculia bacterium]